MRSSDEATMKSVLVIVLVGGDVVDGVRRGVGEIALGREGEGRWGEGMSSTTISLYRFELDSQFLIRFA